MKKKKNGGEVKEGRTIQGVAYHTKCERVPQSNLADDATGGNAENLETIVSLTREL